MSEETTKPQAPAGFNSAIPRADKDAEPGQRFKGKRRRKVSYLTTNKIDTVDYKEINILRRFLNERGKILPARQSGNTAKQQRMIAEAVRRAREMALLPFVVTEMSPDRGGYGPRRERYGDRGDRGDRGGYRGGPRNEENTERAERPAAPSSDAS
jgi:small subunit ribosomal protein S18